jgi:DNA helicase-2/ATP-dependent DNA helicase PcrA
LSQYFVAISEVLTVRAKVGFTDFVNIWRHMEGSDLTPSGLIRAVLDSDYKKYLESEYPDYRERANDIEQLALFAEKELDLAKFLAEAGLQEGFSDPKGQSGTGGENEKIVLSTIHQAKGLEWNSVFLIGVSAGQFPSDRALNEEKGIEEERRLFYVAITRAKNYLHISYPLLTNMSFGSMGGASMFLEEVDQSLLEVSGLGGRTFFSQLDDESEDIHYVADDSIDSEYDEPFSSKKKTMPTSFLKSIDEL